MKEAYSQPDPAVHARHIRTLSWTAIFVGALIAVGLGFLVNLFTVAIGLTAFTIREGSTAFAVGGFLTLTVVTFLIMFVSGWVAGYLGRGHHMKRDMGEIYGFASWCLALILTLMLTSHVGELVNRVNQAITPPGTVTVTNNPSAPTISARETGSSSVTETTINAEQAANTLGVAAFVTFFLFFIGALGSCFGGRFGMVSYGILED